MSERPTIGQRYASIGKRFNIPRLLYDRIPGEGFKIVAWCPSGNVSVKLDSDPAHFGPVTVPPNEALIAEIERRFDGRGKDRKSP